VSFGEAFPHVIGQSVVVVFGLVYDGVNLGTELLR
jgi:hypothetical protein